MPGNDYFELGGVQFPRKEVKTVNYSKKDGKYIVDFKNGTRMAYSESKEGLASSVFLEPPHGNEGFNRTYVNNIKDLEIIGTPQEDRIQVDNSTIRGIDVNDGGEDFVDINNSSTEPLGNAAITEYGMGLIIHDANDEINIDKNSNVIDFEL